jgi:hypothetical protein
MGELKWLVIALAVLTVLAVISVVLEARNGRRKATGDRVR